MRRPITKTARANAGDTVVVSCSLSKGTEMQRISVWSNAPDYDPAPHIVMPPVDMQVHGRPPMLRPTMATLSDLRTHHTFEIVADELLYFRAMQECDVATDSQPRASIRVYSPRMQRLRKRIKAAIAYIKRKASFNGKAQHSQ